MQFASTCVHPLACLPTLDDTGQHELHSAPQLMDTLQLLQHKTAQHAFIKMRFMSPAYQRWMMLHSVSTRTHAWAKAYVTFMLYAWVAAGYIHDIMSHVTCLPALNDAAQHQHQDACLSKGIGHHQVVQHPCCVQKTLIGRQACVQQIAIIT